ncbi:MAG: S8 family serine peptidase [Actinobacteria bacterium]|nr:S8 family serine peptidase [Actinomycetota bacterium]
MLAVGGYGSKSGTSMSSPTVAGGAGLYKAANPSATRVEVSVGLIALGPYDGDASQDRDGVKSRYST